MAGTFYLTCVPAADGIAVSPCGTVEGVALVPSLASAVPPALDYSQVGAFFAFAVSTVLIPWVIGLVVGSVLRVVRAA